MSFVEILKCIKHNVHTDWVVVKGRVWSALIIFKKF